MLPCSGWQIGTGCWIDCPDIQGWCDQDWGTVTLFASTTLLPKHFATLSQTLVMERFGRGYS